MRHKLVLNLFLLMSCLFPFRSDATGSETIPQTSPNQLIARGNACCHRGDMEHAAMFWRHALALLNPEKDADTYMKTTIHLANALQSAGYHHRALAVLDSALARVERSDDAYPKALFFSSLGDIHLSLGNSEKAADYLLRGIEEARSSENPRALIMALNNVGNGLGADRSFAAALTFYDESLGLIENSQKNADLKPKVLLNMARLGLQMESFQEVGDSLESVLSQITEIPDSVHKASDLLTLSRLVSKIQKKMEKENSEPMSGESAKPYRGKLVSVAYKALSEAGRIGDLLQNPRVLSYANGYMGGLYERENRYSEAMKLTRKAIFFAQQGNLAEILYLWQWQMGRLYNSQDDLDNAIKMYHNTVLTLNPIRGELLKGFRSREDLFDETIKPVYLGLTELLLKQAEMPEAQTQQKLLEARDTMEILKTAELEDFFADECLAALQNRGTALEQTPPHTAVLYPTMLPDHLALLLTLPNGMKLVTAQVGSETLRKTAARYRERLQTRPNNRFFYDSQQIYDWVIRPIENVLADQEIDTLIVAPDGALRLIPFATLHDGEHFLIEKYAIGTIPAISLTDPKPPQGDRSNILIGGLSQARQGFPELPGVTEELRNVQKITKGKKVLQDKDYTVGNLTREFKDNEYAMLHIATHGVFGGTPEESFLLTYNDKLTMNRLEQLIRLGQFRKQQVELMTLSACQTALGNERAAMGLAGVAVKAGVKSTVATLWFVDDEATSLAIGEFYKELRKPGISKVKAMQNVQKRLIAQQRYQHPLYWGPFLVIGNWM